MSQAEGYLVVIILYKTGVINDPLGQTHVTPVANIVFCCFVFLNWKSGDRLATCAKTMVPTGRDFGLAEWIIFQLLYLPLKLLKLEN